MREIDTIMSTFIKQMSGSLTAQYHTFDQSKAYEFIWRVAG